VDAISTIIVDDEKPARIRLQSLVSRRPEVRLAGVCSDGRQAVEMIRTLRPQLALLDVQMPGLDGFGVLRSLPAELIPLTIFVTAYDRYAVAAFEAHAVDYLLKPFTDERFDASLDRALESARGLTERDRTLRIESVLAERSALNAGSGFLDRIVLREHDRVTLLAAEDIDWIGAAGVYLELHAGNGTHLYRSTFADLLDRLDPKRFVRIHRSAVVNTDRIVELRPRGHGDYTVVLRGGREITLSRGYRSHLEGWLGQPL
jgi:two-component system LytT family response regulator